MRPRLISNEVLLEAALQAFADLGYQGSSIRELCRHLGVSHNTLNQRFGTKDALWYAAVDHGFKQLIGVLLEAVTSAGPAPIDQLRNTMLQFLASTRENPRLIRIIAQESALPGPRYEYLFVKYVAPINEMGVRPLRQLQAQGKIRQGPVNTVFFYLVTMGLGMMSSLPESFASLGDPDADPADTAELAVNIVLEGLFVRS